MKKSKIKKLFSEVYTEMAKFDGRIAEVEKQSKTNLLDVDFENVQPKASAAMKEPHVLELPERWCVAYDNDRLPIIEKFLNWKRPLIVTYGYLSFIEGNFCLSRACPTSCTEISFSDFERLVLKNRDTQNNTKLEVGKWYKRPHHKALFYVVSEKADDSGMFMVYGFNKDGEWMNPVPQENFGQTTPDRDIEATKEEVVQALLNEAKRRGYKEGTVISPFTNSFRTFKMNSCEIEVSEEHYNGGKDKFALRGGGACIYSNGIWAEIVSQPEEEQIDWSVPQKVIGLGNELIIQTTGKHDEISFQGVTLNNGGVRKEGDLRDNWSKLSFVSYSGEITLKNI